MSDDRSCPYPDALCGEPRFVKVKPYSKQPVEAWGQPSNRYAWDDPELVAHREQGGNVHIVVGNGLVVIDLDDVPFPAFVDELPPTFVVKTPGGGLHKYYRSEYEETHAFPWGEVRGGEALVATPGNTHPSGGEYYTLWSRDIAGVPAPLLASRVEEARAEAADEDDAAVDVEDVDLDDLPDPEDAVDETPSAKEVAAQYDWMQRYPDPEREDRSTFDWAVCCTMLRYGVPKHEVERFLESFPGSKVRERAEGIDYGNTWERARREVGAEVGDYTLRDRPDADDEH